jgi:hypothetical protein
VAARLLEQTLGDHGLQQDDRRMLALAQPQAGAAEKERARDQELRFAGPSDLDLQPAGLDQRVRESGKILVLSAFGNGVQHGQGGIAQLAMPGMDHRDVAQDPGKVAAVGLLLDQPARLVQVAERLAPQAEPVVGDAARQEKARAQRRVRRHLVVEGAQLGEDFLGRHVGGKLVETARHRGVRIGPNLGCVGHGGMRFSRALTAAFAGVS